MDNPEKPRSDVVLLGPPTTDGAGVHVLRAREDRIEAGEMRPLKDGVPLAEGAEVVKLSPRPGAPGICDVEVALARGAPPRAKGPARVSSRSYRQGWDEVFGKSATSKDLN